MRMDESINVYGAPLRPCSHDPLTGFFRNGCCDTSKEDIGSHTICVQVTREFLEYSASCGNDLITPRPEWNFSGLKPGDKWCVCAIRWLEAYRGGAPARVYLHSTHKKALDIVPLEILERFAADDEE